MKCYFYKIAALLSLILFSAAVGRVWYELRDGFSINRIRFALPEIKKNEVDDATVANYFDKPYRYVGRGRQCYVFGSVDGQVVLKIPRFDRYELSFFRKIMPRWLDRRKGDVYFNRQQGLALTLQSFQIAAAGLKRETGVIFLHTHKTDYLPHQFVIQDRIGRSFTIDLNQTVFVLQKRLPLMMPMLALSIKNGDQETAQKMADAFLELIEQRARKGVFNRDPSFYKNFGWDGQHCIQIDIGSFWRKSCPSEKKTVEVSLTEGTEWFRNWLTKMDPVLKERFDGQLQAIIVNFSSD
jgi:hypothetical protein